MDSSTNSNMSSNSNHIKHSSIAAAADANAAAPQWFDLAGSCHSVQVASG